MGPAKSSSSPIRGYDKPEELSGELSENNNIGPRAIEPTPIITHAHLQIFKHVCMAVHHHRHIGIESGRLGRM